MDHQQIAPALNITRPHRLILLFIVLASCVLLSCLMVLFKGPVPYEPSMSDASGLWTQGAWTEVTGTVATVIDVMYTEKVGGFVTDRYARELPFVSHASGIVLPVLHPDEVSPGDNITVSGQLLPIDPNLRNDLLADPLFGAPPFDILRVLHVDSSPGLFVPVTFALIWICLVIAYIRKVSAPEAPSESLLGQPQIVCTRESSLTVSFILIAFPLPVLFFVSEGVFRLVVLAGTIATMWMLLEAARAPYLIFYSQYLCINSIFSRNYIQWYKVREMGIIPDEGWLTECYIETDEDVQVVPLATLFYKPENRLRILWEIRRHAPQAGLSDWPEELQEETPPDEIRPFQAQQAWTIRQTLAMGLSCVGIVIWWGACAPSIMQGGILVSSFFLSAISIPLLFGAIVVEGG